MDVTISQPLPVPARSMRGSWIVIGIFVVCVAGAWAWFNTFVPDKQVSRWVSLSTNFNGFMFAAIPLSKAVETKLFTTNYLNGIYTTVGEQNAIHLFLADWLDSNQSLEVVMHCPDICWTGVGWRSVDLGQPSQIEIPLRSVALGKGITSLIFECRAMKAQNNEIHLVIWSALIGGENLVQTSRFKSETSLMDNLSASGNMTMSKSESHRIRGDLFVTRTINRESALGPKQMLRLSIQVQSEWEKSLAVLHKFIVSNLEIEEWKPLP